MSKKNKLIFHYVGGNVAVPKPQDIFLMITLFYYMLLCCGCKYHLCNTVH